MEKSFALGVDIGGSHITAALIDLEQRTLIQQSIKRKAVNSKEDKTTILNAWVDIINEALGSLPKENGFIGIAMPGPFDYDNGISLIKDQEKFNSLYQVNVKEELAKMLGIPASHINFINDAAGFLQGEVFAGAAKGNANVLGLTLGTGLGSSICINRKAVDADLWQSPFMNGIAEDYLASHWFLKRYQQLSNVSLDGVKELVEVVKTDHKATQVFMEFGYNLAQFLIPVIIQNKIDTIVIGGNIAQAFKEFSPELIATLRGNDIEASIRISELKEHAALIGAASVCSETFS